MSKIDIFTQDDQALAEEKSKNKPLADPAYESNERPYEHQAGVILKRESALEKSVRETLEELTGGKDSKIIQKEVAEGKWPFAISAEQMRADIEEWNKNS